MKKQRKRAGLRELSFSLKRCFGDEKQNILFNVNQFAVCSSGECWGKCGREIMEGRKEERDVFDLYMLSKNIKPLHIFLKHAPRYMQKGIIHWYRTFSRQDIKLALLDLDIYDKDFNARTMIMYLEKEIKQFIKEVIEE